MWLRIYLSGGWSTWEEGRWSFVNALFSIDYCFSSIDYCFIIVSLWVREQKLTEQPW